MTNEYAPSGRTKHTIVLNNYDQITHDIDPRDKRESVLAGAEHGLYGHQVYYEIDSSESFLGPIAKIDITIHDLDSISLMMVKDRGGQIVAKKSGLTGGNALEVYQAILDLKTQQDGSVCVDKAGMHFTPDHPKEKYENSPISPAAAAAFANSVTQQILASPEVDNLRKAITATGSASETLSATANTLVGQLQNIKPCPQR